MPTDGSVVLSSYECKTDPRDAVRAFEDLPEFVRHAKFGQVRERILDAKLFETIVSQRPVRAAETGWADRLKWRCDALRPYIGKTLACVFVRLPGVPMHSSASNV